MSETYSSNTKEDKGKKLVKSFAQDFKELRDHCLRTRKYFEDPDFPCDNSSITSSDIYSEIKWLRPKEIHSNPKFFADGISRFDVKQGQLGDCWFLAAVANLTLYPALFEKVVPKNQSFDKDYAGIFHFRFWQYDRWVHIIIDDRLPTINGKLVYLQSTAPDEFWSALLEKAYAKLYGSYAALDGGIASEAMLDFTGGVSEIYILKNKTPRELFKLMLKAYERNSLMSCSISPNPNEFEAVTREGLVKGHAYSITSVKNLKNQLDQYASENIPLIRLRNPWGNETEWKGAWSDGSREWASIPETIKKDLQLSIENDGEFWMSFHDFKKHFEHLEICNLSPDSLDKDKNDKFQWETNIFEGEWTRGVTAGGCLKHETFCNNPQYRITLIDPDENDDDDECTLIIGLTQKHRRVKRKYGGQMLPIGFAVYPIKKPSRAPKPLSREYFLSTRACSGSPTFTNLRDVSARYKLPPGVYCIIPSAYNADDEGEFVLRVFTEKTTKMETNDDSLGIGQLDDRVITLNESNENYDIKDLFIRAAGKDLEIDWMALQQVLTILVHDVNHPSGFSKDVCRSMVAMLDVDRSGKLGFNEFMSLWMEINQWKAVFKLYDLNNNGRMSAYQLREALNSAGYRLNNHILKILINRYSGKQGSVAFDDFMMCVIRLKKMIELFRAKRGYFSNLISFSQEELIETVLYS